MEPIIKATGLYKSFGMVPVLQDLDIEVVRGDLIAIMGKSGSGKSTLLHIIGTLDQADAGELLIAGENPTILTANQLSDFRNSKIGFVFQFHHLLPEFDLKENICMPGFIAGKEKNRINQRAEFLLKYFDLESHMHQKPSQLSGGEQQRGAICRALFNEPAIILADEPTGNLDQANAEEFHKMIKQLSQDFNQTFVIVTHQPDLAEQCNKVYLLENGKLVKRG
ncbi:MAG: ABC transporter ATP-binding protein [Saprospiraceae bacterium]